MGVDRPTQGQKLALQHVSFDFAYRFNSIPELVGEAER
jgi:hypothetical protein